MSRLPRLVLLVCGFLGIVAAGFGQLGDDIARKHANRTGRKLEVLQSLRAEGKTFIGKEVVPFEFTSQRPNKLRVESFSPLRRVVQAYDGTNPPWISHSDSKSGLPQDMAAADAKDFIDNADFDGLLVNYAAKGYSVDYAGEEKIENRDAYKLLVMNKSDQIFFLWIDTRNYEIVKRTVYRTVQEKRISVDTFFKDFRPVAGGLQPYRVETFADGRLLYVMVIEKMEANLRDIPAGTFVRPVHQP